MPEQTRNNTAGRDAPLAARKVWLTFDNGPHPEYTPRILDVLKARNVVATFFVVGQNVECYGRHLVERAHGEGHGIGNHTFSHKYLTTLSEPEVRAEILRTESLIADLLGPFKLFRPPYGDSNAMVDRVIKELGYLKVLWQADTFDWNPAYQPRQWVQRGVDEVRAHAQSIVLAHDKFATTADHVAEFLDGIASLGPVTFERFWPMGLARMGAGTAYPLTSRR
jgi:peptidoglycan/xylan/chitin deacetylase (PgdA/CDA1 family)